MLPCFFFEKLTRIAGVRIDKRSAERRVGIRIPAMMRPLVYGAGGACLADPVVTRARDISPTGVALLVRKSMPKAKTYVIDFKPGDDAEKFILRGAVRRVLSIDDTWQVFGISFESVLAPGQAIHAGIGISSLFWIDVAGQETPDESAFAI